MGQPVTIQIPTYVLYHFINVDATLVLALMHRGDVMQKHPRPCGPGFLAITI